MAGCGVLLLLAGLISYGYGVTLNNDMEKQLSSMLGKGEANPGSTYIVLGVVAMIVGLALLILGIVKSMKENSDNRALPEDARPLPDASAFFCAFCGAAQAGNAVFCSQCGVCLKAEEKPCPVCGSMPADNAAFCAQCGTRLKEMPVQRSRCPACGTVYLTEEAAFCSKCGSRREDR